MLKTEAEKKQKKITVEDVQYITGIFGNDDKYMEMIGKAFGVTMVLRGDELVITGDDADHAENTVLDMMWVLERGDELDEAESRIYNRAEQRRKVVQEQPAEQRHTVLHTPRKTGKSKDSGTDKLR